MSEEPRKKEYHEIVHQITQMGYKRADVLQAIKDINVRMLWQIDSFVSIYSRGKKQWFEGKIINLFSDQETKEQWLQIQYGKCTKRIQLFNENIKPVTSTIHDSHDRIIAIICDKLKVNQITTHQLTDIENFIIYENRSKGDDCCDGNDTKNCLSLKRIRIALGHYSRFDIVTDANDRKQFIYFMKEVYGNLMHDDYIHSIRKHNDEANEIKGFLYIRSIMNLSDPEPTSYSSHTTTEWHTMPDTYVSEHIRDLLTDYNVGIKDINAGNVRKFVCETLNATKEDKERFNNIMTELRKQEGFFDIDMNNLHENENKESEDEQIFDELTPESYKQKQKQLISTPEYINIRTQYRDKMLQNLANCDKKTLYEQCTNKTCDNNSDIFVSCDSLKRIDILLSLYSKLMKCDTLWKKVAMDPLICIKDLYYHQQIFNDFLHIKLYHIDEDNKLLLINKARDEYKNIAQKIHETFSARYPCSGMKNCFAFHRHYRDRTDKDTEKAMFHSMENDENKKAISIRNEKEWILQEECDKIHSYFLHSTIQFPNTDLSNKLQETIERLSEVRSISDSTNALPVISESSCIQNTEKAEQIDKDTLEIEEKANETVDAINDYALGRSFSIDTKSTNIKPSASEKKSARGYVGEKEDEKWFKQLKEEKNDDEALYRLLVENMGVFRWQSAHGFRTGQHRGLAHLKPKWSNIKQEALNNSYSQASIDNWNSTLRKSKIFYNSFARHRIKTLYESQFVDEVTDTFVKWRAGESIALSEIVMLKLYTDFDKLQHELKKCFRWKAIGKVVDKQVRRQSQNKDVDKHKKMLAERDKENKRDLENRLREFWHWRVGLLQTLNKYGKKINENDMILYHGVNSKMILDPSELLNFYGPLSTTASYHVAKTFATAKGMVLKITSQYPRLDLCRAFDASLISDYPEEQEYLIGFLYMRVLEIRTRPIVSDVMNQTLWDKAPLASKMRVLFFAVHLFGEHMFSMSKHLEYYLVEFLKCHRKDCCQHQKKKLSQEKKESFNDSFLSFLCCEIVKHPEAITKPEDWKDKKLAEKRVLKILWKKFDDFRYDPNFKQAIKIDKISEGLKEFFLKNDTRIKKDIYGNIKYKVSFEKLLYIYPKIKEVHYVNNYRFDNDVLSDLIYFIQKHQSASVNNTIDNRSKLKKVVFLYYDYEDEIDEKTNIKLGHPQTCDTFFHPNKLDKNKLRQLQVLNWIMKYNKNGNTGYKIRIQQNHGLNKKVSSNKNTLSALKTVESNSNISPSLAKRRRGSDFARLSKIKKGKNFDRIKESAAAKKSKPKTTKNKPFPK